jgi:hypothetical protein
VATATGWFRNFFGGKTKEKGKGFEVVRSARMPPAMRARGGEVAGEEPPEGIPVAMGVLRNGPIESDDDEPQGRRRGGSGGDLLNARGDPSLDSEPEDGGAGGGHVTTRISDLPPMLPGIDRSESIKMPSRLQSKSSRHGGSGSGPDDVDLEAGEGGSYLPDIPRKSSKRHSGVPGGYAKGPFGLVSTSEAAEPEHSYYLQGQQAHQQPQRPPQTTAATSRLPFQRTASQKRLSAGSDLEQGEADDFEPVDLRGSRDEERTMSSYGYVPQHSISRVDPDHRRHVDLFGSSAEVVDEQGLGNYPSTEGRAR